MSEKSKKRIAVIRVRGKVHVKIEIEDTMKLINLTRVNHCVVIDDRPQYRGMINKINDYITWGEINTETFTKLMQKRGRLTGNTRLSDEYFAKNTSYKSIEEFAGAFMNFDTELGDIKDLKPVFRLRPPKKGYDRGGIKHPYSTGGALGYRSGKINDLLEKMVG